MYYGEIQVASLNSILKNNYSFVHHLILVVRNIHIKAFTSHLKNNATTCWLVSPMSELQLPGSILGWG
jgi:hypothetical protein